ncbi:hypothetical protein ACHAWF_005294 [Thalassiosira exigua]
MTAGNPKIILLAALTASPSASALLVTHRPHSSRHLPSVRQSTWELEASNGFSELDKLRAKRLGLRRHRPELESEASTVFHDDVDTTNDSLTAGLEYLYEADVERHSDDLFHIILMPSTFFKDHMSTELAAESCAGVLGIPSDKARDLSLFAKHQGFSCLGIWTREECLSMGEQLISRDLDCRVIPFNGGVVSEILPAFPDVSVDMFAQNKAMEDTYLLSYSS